MLELTVPGPPVPMQRARKGAQGRWYTPAKSLEYRDRIQQAWIAAGRVSFDETPVSVSLQVLIARPASHLKRDGTVRPAFVAAVPPGDCDNYAKAAADALNGLAYADDRLIVCWSAIVKAWAAEPSTVIRVWAARLPALAA